ncbi:MAG: hypothetical protein LC754_04945 [Acidobacteria bacterium]|nr:hypothetical protein [Acidobacteriota bacterium]
MQKEIGHSLREYIPAVFNLINVIVFSTVSGMAWLISGTHYSVPWSIWVGIILLLLIVIQFVAFHKVRHERDALKNSIKPTLILEFKHSDDSFHFKSYGGEIYRLSIHNSGFQTIENLQASIAEINPIPQGLPALPLPLVCPRSLNPGADSYISVVGHFTNDYRADKIVILDDIKGDWPVQTLIPFDKYDLTVKVTGRNVPAITETFTVFASGNKVHMMRKLGG